MYSPYRCLLLAAGILANTAILSAQLVTYTFGSTSSPTASPTTVATNLSAGNFSGLVGDPKTGGTSPLSSGAYFTADTWAGTTPGNNYFEFTLTPSAGNAFTTASFRFDYRATSTGPATLALRSSTDSYATPFFSLITTKDSAWHDSGTLVVSAFLDDPMTFRLYGYGASSNGGTLRVDNVVLNGTPVPEPAACAFILGAAALATGSFGRRTRRLRT